MKYSCRCILVKICNYCITCVILSSFHSCIFVRFVLLTLVLSVTCVLLIIVWPFDLFIWPLYYVSGDWLASNYPCGLLTFFLTRGKYIFESICYEMQIIQLSKIMSLLCHFYYIKNNQRDIILELSES